MTQNRRFLTKKGGQKGVKNTPQKRVQKHPFFDPKSDITDLGGTPLFSSKQLKNRVFLEKKKFPNFHIKN